MFFLRDPLSVVGPRIGLGRCREHRGDKRLRKKICLSRLSPRREGCSLRIEESEPRVVGAVADVDEDPCSGPVTNFRRASHVLEKRVVLQQFLDPDGEACVLVEHGVKRVGDAGHDQRGCVLAGTDDGLFVECGQDSVDFGPYQVDQLAAFGLVSLGRGGELVERFGHGRRANAWADKTLAARVYLREKVANSAGSHGGRTGRVVVVSDDYPQLGGGFGRGVAYIFRDRRRQGTDRHIRMTRSLHPSEEAGGHVTGQRPVDACGAGDITLRATRSAEGERHAGFRGRQPHCEAQKKLMRVGGWCA